MLNPRALHRMAEIPEGERVKESLGGGSNMVGGWEGDERGGSLGYGECLDAARASYHQRSTGRNLRGEGGVSADGSPIRPVPLLFLQSRAERACPHSRGPRRCDG